MFVCLDVEESAIIANGKNKISVDLMQFCDYSIVQIRFLFVKCEIGFTRFYVTISTVRQITDSLATQNNENNKQMLN